MLRKLPANSMLLGFALVAVVILISGFLIRNSLGVLKVNNDLVKHTYEVLQRMTRLRMTLFTAESTQRGYIITGQDKFLVENRPAIEESRKILKEIRTLVDDNPRQHEKIEQLIPLVEDRIKTMESVLNVAKEKDLQSARDMITNGLGTGQMAAIIERLDQIRDTELSLLEERDIESTNSQQTAQQMAFLSSAIGLAMVCLAGWLSMREVTHKTRTAAELEKQVEIRTAELNDANQALQQSNRELEQFASVASHDLQEPLRKIEAFGDRLKTHRESLNPQAVDYLDRVLNSASRMRTLINDLLNFSRVASRAQPFRKLELGQVCREVVGDLETRLQQSGGRVEIGELASIEADPTQMRQLFQNLIANALKFKKPEVNSVVRVWSKPAESPNQIQIFVADNGIGFEEQYLDRIFEVFQRLHGRNEYEGTGIGLAICRKIVERHHGAITARSAPGEGATFVVTLPVNQNQKDQSCLTTNQSSS